jgi:UDP-N-acetylmuramate--alanine ligase
MVEAAVLHHQLTQGAWYPMGRVRHVHLVGIGGQGMAGIAEVLLRLGYRVSGSDLRAGPLSMRLAAMGATISIGHEASQIAEADVVVYSSAVPRDNVELEEARSRRIPVIPRAEMLGELMRFRQGIAVAGTHGKTTTTSLIAALLTQAGLDPTFVIGGRVRGMGVHARVGGGMHLVAEADESDGSFLRLSPLVAVVTNVEPDHLENYAGDFQLLQRAFVEFVHRLPFYGLAVVCIDDPVIRSLLPELGRPVLTYGFSEDAQIRAHDAVYQRDGMHFDVSFPGQSARTFVLHVPGRHNILNALAALAVGFDLGLNIEHMTEALAGFSGIERRLQTLGTITLPQGEATVVDDYAHHPSELRATLEAIAQIRPGERLVLVFQPHRYTRTAALLDDFAEVLATVPGLVVLLDVYAAGESPNAGKDSCALEVLLRGRHVPLERMTDVQQTLERLPGLLKHGDTVLIAGAGDVAHLAPALMERWGRESLPT